MKGLRPVRHSVRRPRILMVTEYFPPFCPGGAEWSTQRWAEILSEAGHNVCVAAVDFGAPRFEVKKGRQIGGGYEVRRFPFPLKLPPGQKSTIGYATRNPLFYLSFGLWLWRLARRADVVHAQSDNAIIPAWIASLLAGKPLFMTVRDLGLLCPLGTCLMGTDALPADCGLRRLLGADTRFFQRHYRRRQGWTVRQELRMELLYQWVDVRVKQVCARRAKGIICVSKGLAEIYRTALGLPSTPLQTIHVVHNPLPEHDFQGSAAPGAAERARGFRRKYGLDGKRVVLVAGKMSLGKGTYVVLDAARKLESQCPDLVVAVAGKGSLSSGIPGNVRVLGSVGRDVLAELYHLAEVIAVPSLWPEPLSRVIIEAMSAGRPVVATKIGGSPELVKDGVTGRLVAPGDAAELAEALRQLWADPDQAAVMGMAAREFVREVLDEDGLIGRLMGAYGCEPAGRVDKVLPQRGVEVG